MSSKGLILLTGLNGYIGGRTIEALLEAGYSVRGTVRSRASAQPTLDALSRFGDRLSVVEVPDTSVPGAFDDAVSGVDGIAHLAQLVAASFGDDPLAVVEQTTQSVTGILESAVKAGTVKSVVLMSSATAVFYPTEGPHVYTEEDWSDAWVEVLKALGKDAPPGVPYMSSKVLGERAFWKFREERKPGFTMTAINPFFVSGSPVVPWPSADKIVVSCKYIYDIMNGGELVGPAPEWDWWVDVRDVARLFVYGFEHAGEADGERYLLSTNWGHPQAMSDILRPAYPQLEIREGEPGKGYLPGWKAPPEIVRDMDGSKALRALGGEYVTFERSLLDMAKSFEPLLGKSTV
ncbi:nad dependent epimerase [Colletotrichum plurivorum]|uniref:Nad dependent epimerase n=1 Tax=Colletotrichum plurivorum TaxID=2175906 RepID=A0A8H6KED8_9PEZI|nr:nad dependent epimerase [Colletotrichum plurivorum]